MMMQQGLQARALARGGSAVELRESGDDSQQRKDSSFSSSLLLLRALRLALVTLPGPAANEDQHEDEHKPGEERGGVRQPREMTAELENGYSNVIMGPAVLQSNLAAARLRTEGCFAVQTWARLFCP